MNVIREDTVTIENPQQVTVVYADGEQEILVDNNVKQVTVIDGSDQS